MRFIMENSRLDGTVHLRHGRRRYIHVGWEVLEVDGKYVRNRWPCGKRHDYQSYLNAPTGARRSEPSDGEQRQRHAKLA